MYKTKYYNKYNNCKKFETFTGYLSGWVLTIIWQKPQFIHCSHWSNITCYNIKFFKFIFVHTYPIFHCLIKIRHVRLALSIFCAKKKYVLPTSYLRQIYLRTHFTITTWFYSYILKTQYKLKLGLKRIKKKDNTF